MDYHTKLLSAVAIINVLFSLFVAKQERNPTNILFSLFTLLIGLWSLGIGVFVYTTDLTLALLATVFFYLAPPLIVTIFFFFSVIFVGGKLDKKYFLFLIPFAVLFFVFVFDQHFLIKEITIINNGVHKDVVIDRVHYLYYSLYVVSYIIASYFVLFRSKNSEVVRGKEKQLNVIIVGTLVSYILATFFNLIFPYLGNYQLISYGPLFTLIMVFSIAYAILKYQLFNIKLILVETSLILLNLFLLINVFLSSDVLNLSLSVVIFLSILLFSTLLLRGIYKDIRDRERIEALAKDMEKANERLKVMEQSKTEFVSIASHQLRTPLTVIKGYASMILEGTFGPLGTGPRMAMRNLADASARIVALVEDLLTVSRLEQGRLVLVLKPVNFTEYIRSILAEEESNVRVAGLELTYTVDENKEFYVSIDEKKFKQVVKHILDNAIKYTEPPGTIDFSLSDDQVAQKIRLSISDTGVGMSSPQIKELFERFNMKAAADEALKAPPTMSDKGSSAGSGTKAPGIGLYIAYEVVQAHKGNIHVHSAGTNKGTTFVIELPRTERPPELEGGE